MIAAPARELGTAAVELAKAMVGRTLRKAEQAIDVLRLDQALNAAKDELEAAIFAEMMAATAAWVAGVASSPTLRVTPDMRLPLDRLVQIGRDEGILELERLGYEGVQGPARLFAHATPAPEGRDLEGYLRTNLARIERHIEDELVTADLGAASQSAIAQALLNVPGGRDIASRIISTALIDGLGMTFEANEHLIRCWEYTAILDAGTCVRCAPLDGKRYDSLQALFVDLPNFGPNPHCRGGGRCRCRAVPCKVSDVGQNLPKPEAAAAMPAWKAEIAEKTARVRGELQALDLRPLERLDEANSSKMRAAISRGDDPLAIPEAGTTEVAGRLIPSPKAAALEQDVLRMGELVDDELNARAGVVMRDFNESHLALKLELDTLRANEYKPASDLLSEVRGDLGRYNEAFRARVHAEILAAEPELSTFQAFEKARAAMVQDAGHLERKAAVDKAREALDAVSLKLGEMRRELNKIENARQDLVRKTTLEILDEIRPMGPAAGEQAWSYTTKGVRGKAKERLEEAGQLYPREWLERGRVNPIKPTYRENGRGHHQGAANQSEIVVSGGDRSKIEADLDGFATAIHELAHHLEHSDPRLQALEWAFFQRRTRAAGYGPQEQDFRFPSGMGYGSHESYRPDGFTEKYMGKTYGNSPLSHYELLSMGLESIWTGSYELDLQMRRFILGLLAGL